MRCCRFSRNRPPRGNGKTPCTHTVVRQRAHQLLPPSFLFFFYIDTEGAAARPLSRSVHLLQGGMPSCFLSLGQRFTADRRRSAPFAPLSMRVMSCASKSSCRWFFADTAGAAEGAERSLFRFQSVQGDVYFCFFVFCDDP